MTGQEIVKALRCCAKGLGHDDACENCKAGEAQNRREYIEFAAANVIERLTAENAALREKVPQWISVEERRPEPGKRVLATDGVFVGEAIYALDGRWSGYGGGILRDCLGIVIPHWMPLPSAPKFADILRGAPEEPDTWKRRTQTARVMEQGHRRVYL